MAATQTPDRNATVRHETDADYRCPACDGRMSSDRGYWMCVSCAYVPYHPAD